MKNMLGRYEVHYDRISGVKLWLWLRRDMNCVYKGEDFTENNLILCFSRQDDARRFIKKTLLEERAKFIKEMNGATAKERRVRKNGN